MLDLRNESDRRRWNRICNRWLSVVAAVLYVVLAWHLSENALQFLEVILYPFFMLVAVFVLGAAGFQLVRIFWFWIRGY